MARQRLLGACLGASERWSSAALPRRPLLADYRNGGQQRRMSMLVATSGRGICRRDLTARLELHKQLSRQLRLVGGLVLCQHVPGNAPSVGDMHTLGAGPCTYLGLVVPGRASGAA